jgi:putative ABC transport system permease protein
VKHHDRRAGKTRRDDQPILAVARDVRKLLESNPASIFAAAEQHIFDAQYRSRRAPADIIGTAMSSNETALAFRRLRRRPVFAGLAILTLTIAIGAVAAIFGLLNATLLRPLPFDAPERLVSLRSAPVVGSTDAPIGPGISHANYLDLARTTRTFSALAAYTVENPTLSADGAQPLVLTSAAVTATLANALGIRPMLGRGISPDDDKPRAPAVAVLGHDLWSARFGEDSSVIGTSIMLDGLPHRVVGVFPRGVAFPLTAQLWTAIGSLPGVVFRGQHGLQVIGRLSDGVTLDAANAEMQQLMAGLTQAYPRENGGRSLEARPLRDALVGSADRPVRLLWLATLAVWLLACVNIAWVLLARAVGERHEIAVRRALGATRRQLAVPWLYESLVIVAVSVLAGSGLAVWCSRWLSTALGTASTVGQPALDLRVLIVTILCAVASMVVLIAIPTLLAVRTTEASAVRPSSTGTTRSALGRAATSAVIVGQVAGAVVLSWGAIVVLRSLDRATHVDLGFTPRQLFVANLRLPPYAYRDDARVRAFYTAMLADVGAVPGVVKAAVAVVHPLQSGFTTAFQVAGDPLNTERRARLRSVSADYFRTVGTRLLQGRDVTTDDRADGPRVAVVNEAFKLEVFANQSAIGRRLLRRSFGSPELAAYEIVGVVANERFAGPQSPPEAAIYVPFEQMPFASANLLVRTTVSPKASLVHALRRAVWRYERAVPFDDLRSMEDVAGAFLATPRTLGRVLLAFAAVAGLLMMIGIHGILAQTVGLRRRELAVRRALGAPNGSVIATVIGQTALATSVGLVIGAVLVILSAEILRPFAFEVPGTDPVVMLSTGFLMLSVAMIGAAIPAWRAAKLSPATVLRE